MTGSGGGGSGLEGRGAVVTGGGRGIGAAAARALAEAGCRVVVAARTEAELEAVAAELREAGAEAWAVPVDVTDEESVGELAEAAEARLGDVGVLVASAGIAGSAPVERQSLEGWNRMLAVNATGPFLCIRAFLPGMVESGWGRVVVVASVAALGGARYISAYAASKHAALGLTRAVAAEAAGRGVTANAVCPGYVDTPMTEASVARIVERTGMSEEEALGAILEAGGQDRLLSPEEVAATVRFLCGDAASGINGQAIVMDGAGAGG